MRAVQYLRTPLDRLGLLPRLRRLRKVLRLTVTCRVLRELRHRGIKVECCRALEVFGGNGDMHTVDYASQVAALVVWERRAECQSHLRRNLPKATIKIVDSFAELKSTKARFDLVVVDNPLTIYPPNRCEHCDLFPDLFRVLEESPFDRSVQQLDVFTRANLARELAALLDRCLVRGGAHEAPEREPVAFGTNV